MSEIDPTAAAAAASVVQLNIVPSMTWGSSGDTSEAAEAQLEPSSSEDAQEAADLARHLVPPLPPPYPRAAEGRSK